MCFWYTNKQTNSNNEETRVIFCNLATELRKTYIPRNFLSFQGDNVSITCLAVAGRVHGALGFSWARERTLLPLAPGREVWEDLYPAGSVLKLYNVQVGCGN